MIQIKRALISVSDKSNLIEIAGYLAKNGVEILSTGGTLKELQKNSIPSIPIENFTGYPEMLEGRVKTLHPKVHAALLADPDRPLQKKDIEDHKIESIDLAIVNLYPFSKTIQKKDTTLEIAIENIDIGGPTMLRSGAKNYKHTVVVTDIQDYPLIIEEMKAHNNSISEKTSFNLAVKVFSHTALYDSMISKYLNHIRGETFPEILTMGFIKKQSLRYGENPHQKAAFYAPPIEKSNLSPLQGKELSFNNLLDFDSALHIASQMPRGTVSIIKHLNPCGIASAKTPLESFELARRTDPVSAFGGVIGVSGEVDGSLANKILENFVEGVIAEKFTVDALESFAKKPNIRLIEMGMLQESLGELDYRPIHHGMLLQDRDYSKIHEKELKVVTLKKPTDEDIEGLMFAWNCVKFIKSNAIVFTDKNSTLGIGAGQMSRVDSVEIATLKAKKSALSLGGSYVASDAFFPFRDGIDALAGSGVKAIIQPGGSIRDEEVIQAANEHGLIMVFTGMRHFRH